MRITRAIEQVGVEVVALVLLAIAELEVWLLDEMAGSRPALTAWTLLWGLPLLLRRRFPFAAPAVAAIALGLEAVLWDFAVSASFASFMMALLIAGSFGLLGPNRAGFGGAALLAVVVTVTVLRDPEGSPSNLLSVMPLCGIAWVIGFAFHGRNRRTGELEARAARLERERDMEARAAAAEERARIAREMHDVVAHSLSVMVVQAEAAAEMLDVDPERARRPLAAVQDTGRSALTELRRMLGVLREMADEGPALAPQPGLSAIGELVRQVREAGLPVSVRVEGRPRPLPPGIDLSAYRIVQEGLTNALKHAGPARAEVLVRYGERQLELTVSDDGLGHDPASNGGGHGLLGMRERVALYGGRLTAGARPEGGFALSAHLPLETMTAS